MLRMSDDDDDNDDDDDVRSASDEDEDELAKALEQIRQGCTKLDLDGACRGTKGQKPACSSGDYARP